MSGVSVSRRISNEPRSPWEDGCLHPYYGALAVRRELCAARERELTAARGETLEEFASGHHFFGLHRKLDHWVFREYAPHAEQLILAGDFSDWNNDERFRLKAVGGGVWEGVFPLDAISHGMNYCLRVKWAHGGGERLPAYVQYAVQDPESLRFAAQVWAPEEPYKFKYPSPEAVSPLIYEAHIGIATEDYAVGSYAGFIRNVLPDIARKGYNTVQLMGVMEHPYYGSFGYHVSNLFAVSSRFGTPDEFKMLVDEAHRLGLRVIIDLVHSHAVKNSHEGLGEIDGSRETYFHSGKRGEHEAWDSLCFDYGKPAVLKLLLSNCRFYLEEYNVDGFRFDGVTSMLYKHHGLNKVFSSYADYFNDDVDRDAFVYLTLANKLIHRLRPDAITIAEDVSGMPLLANAEGAGFDYRLAMGISDCWFKLLDIPDESWNMSWLFYELTNRRQDERTIGYVECHDQAIVGGQSAFFRLAGRAVYDAMHRDAENIAVDRAAALHKMMRLITAACCGHGYLNFMGNEFGHPEWVDLPREGNNWSFHHARRQWSLERDENLRYAQLSRFDGAFMKLVSEKEFYRCRVQLLNLNDERKVIAFERNGLVFVFNFHPENSYTDYEFEVPSGSYRQALDSDSSEFGGFDRRIPDQEHFTLPRREGEFLSLYLPARTALVLKRHCRT
ncbi:MAG: alpha amylase C-terminal domain-containing protein [Lentisphaeria bacterium]|nr:alpha amylase C-terminal domain-containing protein [Lentisphaeria bacterium]